MYFKGKRRRSTVLKRPLDIKKAEGSRELPVDVKKNTQK